MIKKNLSPPYWDNISNVVSLSAIQVFVYTPLVPETEYIRQESNSFLNKYYNGNIVSMLTSYLEDDKLSKTELDTLRHLLSDTHE